MSMDLQELRANEACARSKWRSFAEDGNTIWQERWHHGRRVVRLVQYGTLSNPHAPSRWRVIGYQRPNGTPCDTFSEASKKSQ